MATTWGIHNDQTSVDPVADDAVRIGWDEMGDLSGVEATRDAFKAAVAERMPQIDEASIRNQAGTVYRFVHAMKVGDIVVCPDRRTSTLNIGRVSGPYEFHPESDVHKQWRPVEWIRTGVPRNELSYAAQEEFGSATTLFQISTGEDEIGHLLATPQPDMKPDYSWSDFYPRLADALMEFRGDRTALLDKMWAASNALARVQASAPIEGRPSPATAVEREEPSRRLQRDRQVNQGVVTCNRPGQLRERHCLSSRQQWTANLGM